MLPYLLLGLLYHYTENLQSAEEMLTRARDPILKTIRIKKCLIVLLRDCSKINVRRFDAKDLQ